MSKSIIAAAVLVASAVVAGSASAATFSNGGTIYIPASGSYGPASPYPSTIDVSGVTGMVTDVNITLNGLSHSYSGDLEIALHGPTGQRVALLGDYGGSANWTYDWVTFSDGAGAPVVGSSGTYSTAGTGCDNMNICGGASPLLSAFNGLDPNGTWELYVFDDFGGDRGAIYHGWTLDLTTEVAPVPLPAGLPLLAGALGILGVARRRRKA